MFFPQHFMELRKLASWGQLLAFSPHDSTDRVRMTEGGDDGLSNRALDLARKLDAFPASLYELKFNCHRSHARVHDKHVRNIGAKKLHNLKRL